MGSKRLSKRGVLLAILGGIAFYSLIIFFLTLDPPSQSSFSKSASGQSSQDLIDGQSVESAQSSAQKTSGLPMRLKIPKINVDAAVQYVGLTSDGKMDVPKGPDDVAWYYLGPRPGDKGSSAIAGHFGWKNNTPAVFDNLHKLQKGDKLYIEDEDGVTMTFVVRESKGYDPKTLAAEVFISKDDKAHLNLITCEGIWDKVSKSYSQRLVVFTDRVME